MSLDADALADRRRLRRKLSFWRVVAFGLVILAALGAGIFLAEEDGGLLGRGEHIARISIDGLITDDRRQQELLERVTEDDSVKAVLLEINSPGGTTTGSEALYEHIRAAAAKKPVVAVMGTIATSGGYIAAIAADHIVARGNTITGSIGVIFQWAQFAELLDTLGIKFNEIKSAPLKAEPSPFNETSEEARAVMRGMIADSYQWFLGLVAERRGLSAEDARRLGDGRVYSGRQAKEVRLIDEIGGEAQARRWLNAEHGLSLELKVRDWEARSDLEAFGLSRALVYAVLGLFGLEAENFGGFFGNLRPVESLRLDGLVSVWHAPRGQGN